ncbi:hypothetical protein P5G50_18455 [Leifsonia sp. F6_8S_P_1B]|uniref:Helix-turn-helix domain-containing protein n=1 Tax=Leifsonia williamsii TaxID=3035919 RepID=A0ABT8KG41_9MICO|nr:hypothetical protein [Leifsonia williamsii]MDN4616434.1 hypothetical protein [Leifsonia williamsii]
MKVEFPDAVWGRLASIADKREMRIADLIVETAHHLLGTTPPHPTQRPPAPNGGNHGARPALNWHDPAVEAEIRELITLHRSGPQIAAHFGVSYDSVRTALKGLNIPTDTRKITNPKGNEA